MVYSTYEATQDYTIVGEKKSKRKSPGFLLASTLGGIFVGPAFFCLTKGLLWSVRLSGVNWGGTRLRVAAKLANLNRSMYDRNYFFFYSTLCIIRTIIDLHVRFRAVNISNIRVVRTPANLYCIRACVLYSVGT